MSPCGPDNTGEMAAVIDFISGTGGCMDIENLLSKASG